jgi:hypothetical protein
VREGGEGREGIALAGGLRRGRREEGDGVVGEDDGAVAVGFEVDADVEAGGSMVEVLHACGGADRGQLEHFGDVVRGSAVCVSGLDEADFELGGEACLLGEVCEEEGGERGDAVAVEELELGRLVEVVVD